jgi:hypothetical protein
MKPKLFCASEGGPSILQIMKTHVDEGIESLFVASSSSSDNMTVSSSENEMDARERSKLHFTGFHTSSPNLLFSLIMEKDDPDRSTGRASVEFETADAASTCAKELSETASLFIIPFSVSHCFFTPMQGTDHKFKIHHNRRFDTEGVLKIWRHCENQHYYGER